MYQQESESASAIIKPIEAGSDPDCGIAELCAQQRQRMGARYRGAVLFKMHAVNLALFPDFGFYRNSKRCRGIEDFGNTSALPISSAD